mmetsp:Transcript_105664/g.336442  ORF Transcript_105664/g.336442 Transcript_105664/m.336442 type:complete len:360 (-) Transcript_105664:131-1210(-)
MPRHTPAMPPSSAVAGGNVTNAAVLGPVDASADTDREVDCHTRSSPGIGITDKAMVTVGDTIDDTLRPLLLNRCTTIGALVLILLLHGLQWWGKAHLPNWHTFLVHLVVLNIFYSERSVTTALLMYTSDHRCPFLFSAAFLILDATIHALIMSYRPHRLRGKAKNAKVVNRYMQVGDQFSTATLYFVGQLSLMMVFVFELNRDTETKHVCNVSFSKWCVASILTIISGQTEVGHEYDPRFWKELLRQEVADEKGYVFLCIEAKNKYIWQARRVFSFIVNNLFRMLILGLSPILLCVSTSMEFIKDSLALFFITKLDDVDKGTSIQMELEKMRERALRRSEVGAFYDALEEEEQENLSPA